MNDERFQIAGFSGEIDFTTRDELRSRLAPLSEARAPIVDLSAVTYMDSSALAEILYVQRRRDQSGRTRVWVVASPAVRRLFEAAGLVGVLSVAATLDEAKASS
ncbi:MAG: STAS domain-containing protein [Candidatus Aquilonibacter sp.]